MTDRAGALAARQPETLRFPPTSRYYARRHGDAGDAGRHGRSSICAAGSCRSRSGSHLLQEHTSSQGERLDNIAAQYLGDPEQFWRLCDANGALRPGELTETVGRRLRITLPEGIPGVAQCLRASTSRC